MTELFGDIGFGLLTGTDHKITEISPPIQNLFLLLELIDSNNEIVRVETNCMPKSTIGLLEKSNLEKRKNCTLCLIIKSNRSNILTQLSHMNWFNLN